jgi:hypothetical protein
MVELQFGKVSRSPTGLGGCAWRQGRGISLRRKIQEIEALLGEQAKMAGDTNPFAIFEDPRIGETAAVFVVLAFVGSLFVRCASDDDGAAVAVKLHIF